jgi:hypothetical protein
LTKEEKHQKEEDFKKACNDYWQSPNKSDALKIWDCLYSACEANSIIYCNKLGFTLSEEDLYDKVTDATLYLYNRVVNSHFVINSLGTYSVWAVKYAMLKQSKEEQVYNFTDVEAFCGERYRIENIGE